MSAMDVVETNLAAELRDCLISAQRTFVHVCTGVSGIDGIAPTAVEKYRALHALYHPARFPAFQLLKGRPAALPPPQPVSNSPAKRAPTGAAVPAKRAKVAAQ